MKNPKRNPNNEVMTIIKSLKTHIQQSLKDEGFVYFKKGGKTQLGNFYEQIKDCKLCELHKTRINFVFGEGSPDAKVVFIGEAPGRDEDEQGRPFVGRAGQLLTKIIESINFKREEVFILNILKCRPPNNRPPEPDEVEKCKPYLEKQLEMINPVIICTLGNPSTQTLLNTKEGITKIRGNIFFWKGIEVIPTLHPSACLRFPDYKKDVWKDVKLLRKEYDRLCRCSG
ncbi:MAG: uracil-DNA glycosylase [Candidatus Firestonebacteria bacterium]